MDFSLSEEQQATRELANQILGDLMTPERHRELELAGEWTDTKVWSALADAGLLGIAVPEAHGGAGLGFLEVALVLEEVGRTTAKVPYLPTVVLVPCRSPSSARPNSSRSGCRRSCRAKRR
jgi:alkylation response protein AidB-like acyl-CoA dehydrogenase